MKIIICDKIHEAGIPLLVDDGHDILRGDVLSREDLLKVLPYYDAAIVRTETLVNEEFLDVGSRLQVIGRAGVGLDNIDLSAAEARGIHICNTPEANTTSAAELTIGMMLSIARHIPQATGGTRQGRWERHLFMGTELNGKRLGIIGFGRVGNRVSVVAKSLGMHVSAYDPYVFSGIDEDDDSHNCSVDSVKDIELIFLDSDFITIHTPLTDETRGMVNISLLPYMKKTAYLINCARGPIVDQTDLIWALDNSYLSGYACDVFEKEPVKDPDHPFYQRRNVICTPHIGAQTYEAQERVSIEICTKVKEALCQRLNS